MGTDKGLVVITMGRDWDRWVKQVEEIKRHKTFNQYKLIVEMKVLKNCKWL